MEFHPTAKPHFVRHVTARLENLRAELAALRALPEAAMPLVFEIGCGHGHFLTRYAALNPAKFCVGIDIIGDRLERSNRKRDRAGLRNLHFLRAEAAEFLACLPAEWRCTEVFLLFPDPWPKKRHHKNRLVRPDFMTALADRTVSGGHFHFRTDHADYFAAGLEVMASHPRWKLRPELPWPLDEATIFQLRAPSFQSLIASAI